MTFLPLNQALLIVGGRNDEVCKNLGTPFLEDIHLFLLDQKAWVSVKYTPFSQRLFRLGNHCMATMSDQETFEKTIVFGGITHSKVGVHEENNSSSNKGMEKKKNSSKKDKIESELSETQETVADDQPEVSHLSNDLYALEIRQIM